MFLTILGLLALAVLVRIVVFAIKWFMAWLGRGKPIRRAAENREVPEDVREIAQKLDDYHRYKAYRKDMGKPVRLSARQLMVVARAEGIVRDDYVNHMRIGWYQIVIIFLVGSVAGLFLEEGWMFLTAHIVEGRYGLVWGPFSPLYGVGAVLLTVISLQLRRHDARWWQIFLVAMVVGGLLEQLTGWGMETFMGAVSWDYSHVPGHITKWVAMPFLVMWGALGVIWADVITPWLLELIGEPRTERQVAFVFLLAAYLAADIFMTLACFGRRAERDAGVPPSNAFEQWVDQNYSDQFMSSRFQNMVIEGKKE
jgi:uncharacterized membrane protein